MSVFDDMNLIKPYKKRKMTYATAYRLWYIKLAEKVINIFKWYGLPFEQHEMEIRLQLYGNGHAGVVRPSNLGREIVVSGSGTGVTEYPDKYIDYTWACPVAFGMSKIGENIAVIYNNSLHTPTRLIVQRYAHLLAHAELSLQAILINSRSTGILAAADEKQRDDITAFYNALEDGRTLAIVDNSSLSGLLNSEGLRAISTAYPSSTHILDFWQARENLYKEFLTEIGISKSTDKRERLITDEIKQDKPLYKYSLDDMLQCRKRGADDINNIFGLSVSVEINETILNEESEGGENVTDNDRVAD